MKLTYEHKELFEQLMVVAKAAIDSSDDSFDAADEFRIWVEEAHEDPEGYIDVNVTRAAVDKRLDEILELINSTL